MKKVYDLLKENNISLIWSVRDKLQTPSIVTSDQVYIRFIGDRSISEEDFGKIVKDTRKEMLEYIKKVRETQDENSNIGNVLIAFNNHFAGFGPQFANDFLNLMNMPEIEWKSELESYENNSAQSSLSNFSR
jgi:hypothetical protein